MYSRWKKVFTFVSFIGGFLCLAGAGVFLGTGLENAVNIRVIGDILLTTGAINLFMGLVAYKILAYRKDHKIPKNLG